MKNTTSRISLTLLLMTVSSALVAADSMQAIADRTLIRELMDRYGIVHDSGISNAQITITGAGTATGTCYVTTVVKKGDVGPSILSISRYTDR